MVETDVLGYLVGLLQNRDRDIQWLSIKAIAALANFGRLIYHLYCAWTDDPTDSFRSRMVETDVLDCLVGLLKDSSDWSIQQSSIKVITALAKSSRLIYHFVLCED